MTKLTTKKPTHVSYLELIEAKLCCLCFSIKSHNLHMSNKKITSSLSYLRGLKAADVLFIVLQFCLFYTTEMAWNKNRGITSGPQTPSNCWKCSTSVSSPTRKFKTLREWPLCPQGLNFYQVSSWGLFPYFITELKCCRFSYSINATNVSHQSCRCTFYIYTE